MNSADFDPRYSLANERTFLAWIRTALGLLAGAAGLLAIDLPWPEAIVHALAAFLAAVSGLSAFLAWIRWRRIEDAIRDNRPVPTPRAHVVLVLAVAAVAAVVGILAIV
jgi:putative membrane protein